MWITRLSPSVARPTIESIARTLVPCSPITRVEEQKDRLPTLLMNDSYFFTERSPGVSTPSLERASSVFLHG